MTHRPPVFLSDRSKSSLQRSSTLKDTLLEMGRSNKLILKNYGQVSFIAALLTYARASSYGSVLRGWSRGPRTFKRATKLQEDHKMQSRPQLGWSCKPCITCSLPETMHDCMTAACVLHICPQAMLYSMFTAALIIPMVYALSKLPWHIKNPPGVQPVFDLNKPTFELSLIFQCIFPLSLYALILYACIKSTWKIPKVLLIFTCVSVSISTMVSTDHHVAWCMGRGHI